jgi:hypothetical protein
MTYFSLISLLMYSQFHSFRLISDMTYAYNMESGQSQKKMSLLSPAQRANIEELVQLSPQVIKARVRREGISAASVLDAYARPAGQPVRNERDPRDLPSQH